MQKSTYISAGGHALLLGYAFFGGLFNAEPLELPTMDVSVVSEAEFAALIAPQQPPEVEPTAPEPVLAAPEPEPEPIIPTPEPIPEPRPESPQIIAPEPAPLPPEPAPEPEPAPIPEPAPVIIPDNAPETSMRPKPRPADRVAQEAVAAPDPDVAIDNTEAEATQPDENAEQIAEEQAETAPEEATTEIVTEAEQPAASAPSSSKHPKARPRETAATPDTSSAVNAALAEALGEPEASEEPTGPPLSAGETNALRLAVQNCWVVDVGSQAANVTVVVGMSMDLRGKVVPGSLRLVTSKGGEGAAVDTAFQAARRAVLRCQKEGYDLPDEKYEQWKEIEMTFNPKDMRIR